MKKQKFEDVLFYKIIRPLVTIFCKVVFHPTIIGQENIPSQGRIILAGNHTNNFDSILLISSTKRNIHFLAKKELWEGPKKIIFSSLGLIPVDRSKKDHHSLEIAYNYLQNDKVIGIFPEGTTEKGRPLLPFKIGAVKMASEKDSPIIPFVIKGEYKLFSKNLQIEFLKPFKINPQLSLDDNNDHLRNIIKEKLEADINVHI